MKAKQPPHRVVQPPKKKRPDSKYIFASAVSLLTFILYLPTLSHEFVNWDDSQYIYENLHIRSFDLDLFRWAFFEFYAANWHPLTWISHALDYAIWGLNPLGHHLTNNVLHTLNTFLVVLLASRLIEAVGVHSQLTVHGSSAAAEKPGAGASRFTLIAAATTGLLFGLHPLHVESVAWVAERKDLLCALFYLLSVMMYVSYRSHKTYIKYILTLYFFVFALLSKPMAVSLPIVLLILDWYPFQRIQSLKTLLAAVMEKLPLIALSLISSLLTVLAQRSGGATELMNSAPFSARLLVAAKSLIAYLWKMILPARLIPLYPYPENISFLSPEYFLPLVLVAGITVSCLLALRKQRLWLSCWGYYVITMIPVLGLVQVGYQAMADRYTYLPGLGPFLLAGLSAAWLAAPSDASKKRSFTFNLLVGTMVIILIASLSYVTLKQISIWKNSVALWTYVISKEPSSTEIVYDNRGAAFNDLGQFDKAIEDFNRAVALNPSYSLAYRNRASAFLNMGQPDKAIGDLDRAIALEPSAAAYYLRATVFDREGETDKAIGDYEQVIALNPSYRSAYFNLGVLYGKTGSIEKAIECFNKTIDSKPDHFLAYGNRGLAYSLMGQYDKALKDLDRAVELNQGYAEAYGNRGNVYLKIGQKEFAIRDFKKACERGDREACNVVSGLQR